MAPNLVKGGEKTNKHAWMTTLVETKEKVSLLCCDFHASQGGTAKKPEDAVTRICSLIFSSSIYCHPTTHYQLQLFLSILPTLINPQTRCHRCNIEVWMLVLQACWRKKHTNADICISVKEMKKKKKKPVTSAQLGIFWEEAISCQQDKRGIVKIWKCNLMHTYINIYIFSVVLIMMQNLRLFW